MEAVFMKLTDGEPSRIVDGERSELSVRFEQHPDGFILIAVLGHGDHDSVDGEGAPILLELLDGKVRLHVWGDINKDDPTVVIDMSGARESARKEKA